MKCVERDTLRRMICSLRITLHAVELSLAQTRTSVTLPSCSGVPWSYCRFSCPASLTPETCS